MLPPHRSQLGSYQVFKPISECLSGALMLPSIAPVGDRPSSSQGAGGFSFSAQCSCGNPSPRYYGPHDPDCTWWDQLDLFDSGQQLPMFLRRQAE